MDQRPMSPYSLCNAHGRIHVWGGEGERGATVEVTVEGADGAEGTEDVEETPEAKAAKETQDKIDKAEAKAKDADKRATDAEKALKEKEQEGMEEHEKTEAERDDYKEKYEKLLKFVETTAIDTAINELSSKKDKNGNPKYDWNDVKAVRPFLDKEAIKLDLDNLEIEGLEPQLQDIAKRMPFLLVPKETRDGGSGDFSPSDTRNTGNHPFGATPRARETDKGKLANKYKFDHLVAPSR